MLSPGGRREAPPAEEESPQEGKEEATPTKAKAIGGGGALRLDDVLYLADMDSEALCLHLLHQESGTPQRPSSPDK